MSTDAVETTRLAIQIEEYFKRVRGDSPPPEFPEPEPEPDPISITQAFDEFGIGSDGAESQADSGGGEDKARAAAIIKSIGRDFVALRKQGRSPAWAELEDRLMANAHVLISAGMLSPKDWISISVNIEEFRKQEQGTSILPADFIASWLSEPSQIEPDPVIRPELLSNKLEFKNSKRGRPRKNAKPVDREESDSD